MPHVKEQIKLLWSEKMIKILFSDLLTYVEVEKEQAATKKEPSPSKSVYRIVVVLVYVLFYSFSCITIWISIVKSMPFKTMSDSRLCILIFNIENLIYIYYMYGTYTTNYLT